MKSLMRLLKRTTVFNAGHGDAIILKLNNNEIVFRDFGSYNNNQMHIVRILPLLLKCQPTQDRALMEAILTHPHEDHFSGYLEMYNLGMRNVFRNAYIPWLDLSTLNSLHGLVLKLSVYYYAYYGLKSFKGVRAKNWILMAPVMADLADYIHGVSAGHRMQHWDPVGVVHWPPPPDVDYSFGYRSLLNAIEGIEGSLTDNIKNDITDNIFEPLRILIQGTLSQEARYESSENARKAEEILNRINEYSTLAESMHLSKSGETAYSRSIDDHSIVLSLIDNSALFLSDLHDGSINKMCKNYLSKNIKFRLLKSSHHGTRFGRGLVKNNITADIIIHCCGRSQSNYSGPNPDYFQISKAISCTDWDCCSKKWKNRNQYKIFTSCYETY